MKHFSISICWFLLIIIFRSYGNEESIHTLKTNVSMVSDYRFRGISQTMHQPAIQGGFDYTHESGFYLGSWASNIDGTTHVYNNTSLEWDFYGGYKRRLLPYVLPDLIINIGLIYYYFPGGKADVPKEVRYNTAEWYVELTYKWLSIKYWQSFTNAFGINADNPPFNWNKNRHDCPNGSTYCSDYIEMNAAFDLLHEVHYGKYLKGGKLNLLLHAGHERVKNYSQLNYTEWRVTLTQDFNWLNLFTSFVGTNARKPYYDIPDNAYHSKRKNLGAAGAVIGIIKIF